MASTRSGDPGRRRSTPRTGLAVGDPATRDALRRAALELFATIGYEETTSGQIAQHAGVSRRTFHNYFPSKVDVLFALARMSQERIDEQIREQPDAPSDLDVVHGAVLAHLDEFDPVDEQARQAEMRLLRRAASTSPTVYGYYLQTHAEMAAATAAALARRRGVDDPDDEAQMAAALGQLLVRRAADRFNIGDDRSMRELVVEQFELAARTIAGARVMRAASRTSGP
jgi:AcrR family transcriptional regulator